MQEEQLGFTSCSKQNMPSGREHFVLMLHTPNAFMPQHITECFMMYSLSSLLLLGIKQDIH